MKIKGNQKLVESLKIIFDDIEKSKYYMELIDSNLDMDYTIESLSNLRDYFSNSYMKESINDESINEEITIDYLKVYGYYILKTLSILFDGEVFYKGNNIDNVFKSDCFGIRINGEDGEEVIYPFDVITEYCYDYEKNKIHNNNIRYNQLIPIKDLTEDELELLTGKRLN